MTTQQLHQFNTLHLAILFVVAVFTRATTSPGRRFLGSGLIGLVRLRG